MDVPHFCMVCQCDSGKAWEYIEEIARLRTYACLELQVTTFQLTPPTIFWQKRLLITVNVSSVTEGHLIKTIFAMFNSFTILFTFEIEQLKYENT